MTIDTHIENAQQCLDDQDAIGGLYELSLAKDLGASPDDVADLEAACDTQMTFMALLDYATQSDADAVKQYFALCKSNPGQAVKLFNHADKNTQGSIVCFEKLIDYSRQVGKTMQELFGNALRKYSQQS